MSQWKYEQLQKQERFWAQVRNGATWTAACEAAGVDRAQGYRWRRAVGGRIPAAPRMVSGRFLGLEERLQIADLRLAGQGVRAIARVLGRAPSTVSRELTRAGVPTAGPGRPRPATARRAYAPYVEHQRAAARSQRPKVAKLDDPTVGVCLVPGSVEALK